MAKENDIKKTTDIDFFKICRFQKQFFKMSFLALRDHSHGRKIMFPFREKEFVAFVFRSLRTYVIKTSINHKQYSP